MARTLIKSGKTPVHLQEQSGSRGNGYLIDSITFDQPILVWKGSKITFYSELDLWAEEPSVMNYSISGRRYASAKSKAGIKRPRSSSSPGPRRQGTRGSRSKKQGD